MIRAFISVSIQMMTRPKATQAAAGPSVLLTNSAIESIRGYELAFAGVRGFVKVPRSGTSSWLASASMRRAQEEPGTSYVLHPYDATVRMSAGRRHDEAAGGRQSGVASHWNCMRFLDSVIPAMNMKRAWSHHLADGS